MSALFAPAPAAARHYRGFGHADYFFGPPPGDFFDWRPRHRVSHHREREHARKAADQARKDPPPEPKGPLLIAISIADQRLTLYDNGVAVAQSPVSTGMAGHSTPTGVFSVIQKQRWHESNIYSGAPMPFMQRITWSGVALHLGQLPGYPASHGCIRMPAEFAARLWVTTKVGARVIIAQDEVVPAEISHPNLFARKAKPPADAPMAAPARPADAPADGSSSAPQAPGARIEAIGLAAENDAMPRDIGLRLTQTDAAGSDGRTPAAAGSKLADAASDLATPRSAAGLPVPGEKSLRPGPISVFVSRKEGRLYVRKRFEPLFDVAVTIRNPEQPIGTHLYTAMEFKSDGLTMRWTGLTMPAGRAADRRAETETKSSHRKHQKQVAAAAPDPVPAVSAAEALDRIQIPPEALDRIAELLSPGASLIVSDQGLGSETGRETDFIVLTR